jgi:hypothetical protein
MWNLQWIKWRKGMSSPSASASPADSDSIIIIIILPPTLYSFDIKSVAK